MTTPAATEVGIIGRLRQAWSSSGSPFGKKKNASAATAKTTTNTTTTITTNDPPTNTTALPTAPSTPETPAPGAYFASKLAEGQYHSKEEYAKMYAAAKANGTFQQKTTVFVRPARSRPAAASAPQPASVAPTPQSDLVPQPPSTIQPTPTPKAAPSIRPSASKKDLAKQLKLSKKVSNLEVKLAAARKELAAVIGEGVPPVPAIPSTLPPTPNTLKKRKASQVILEDKPTQTESDYESDSISEPARKRTRSVVVKRSARLSEKRSLNEKEKETVVTVVPDGASVPPIPSIPAGIEGKRAQSVLKRQSLHSLKTFKSFKSIRTYFETQKRRGDVEEQSNKAKEGAEETERCTE